MKIRSLSWVSLAFLTAAIAFLLVLAVLSQANPLHTFPSLDSGYYLYIGQQILQGKIPYLDLWESKPPGIFYLNALGLLLGRGTRWGIWALEMFSLLLSAALGFFVARRHHGFFPGLFGMLVWLWGIWGVLQGGNLTEEYSLPFNFAAILFFSLSLQFPQNRYYPLLIGMMFASSFLLRANNTGAQIALVLAWLLSALFQWDGRLLVFRLLWSGLAVLLALGVTGLFFAVQGGLGEMIDAALIFNFYLSGGEKNIFSGITAGFGFIGIPAGFALLGYILLLAVFRKDKPWELFLIILFPLEAIFSSLSGRGYPHYYITWMPALALLSAYLLSNLQELLKMLNTHRVLVTFGVLLVLFFLLISPLDEITSSLLQVATNRQQGIEVDDPLAAYLRENTEPDDLVLVWGDRLAYNYLSRRESPSSVLFYPLLADSPISSRLADRFLSELTDSPPTLIIDTHAVNQDLLPALDPEIRREQEQTGKLWKDLPANISLFYEFVEQNYVQEAVVKGSSIYRIRHP